jgi:hypothetical protein
MMSQVSDRTTAVRPIPAGSADRIFALSHFRTENRMPLFLKMLQSVP